MGRRQAVRLEGAAQAVVAVEVGAAVASRIGNTDPGVSGATAAVVGSTGRLQLAAGVGAGPMAAAAAVTHVQGADLLLAAVVVAAAEGTGLPVTYGAGHGVPRPVAAVATEGADLLVATAVIDGAGLGLLAAAVKEGAVHDLLEAAAATEGAGLLVAVAATATGAVGPVAAAGMIPKAAARGGAALAAAESTAAAVAVVVGVAVEPRQLPVDARPAVDVVLEPVA